MHAILDHSSQSSTNKVVVSNKVKAQQKYEARQVLPKFRETPMTRPEVRYYKEVFRTDKNVAQTRSSINHIVHEAPPAQAHPRAENLQNARMMKSSFEMFPKEKDADTFKAPAKRSNAANSQFATSEKLYGAADSMRPAQKKLSAVKIAEIGGSGTVKPL